MAPHTERSLRLVALLALAALAIPGCATTWLTSELAARRPPFDEGARTAAVPLPGVTEQLDVTLHLAGLPAAPPSSSGGGGATAAPAPPSPRDTTLRLVCQVSQTGREQVHRAATRYGRKWKWITASFFVLEAGLTALVAAADDKRPTDWLAGGWMALDALGTGVLFFAPRRDVYEQTEREDVVVVRRDCPEGLYLELDGRPVPVDALGGVGELGQALLERHVPRGAAPIRVHAADRVAEVSLSPGQRCRWARERGHASAQALCADPQAQLYTGTDALVIGVRLQVEPGALTAAPPPPAPVEPPPGESSPAEPPPGEPSPPAP